MHINLSTQMSTLCFSCYFKIQENNKLKIEYNDLSQEYIKKYEKVEYWKQKYID